MKKGVGTVLVNKSNLYKKYDENEDAQTVILDLLNICKNGKFAFRGYNKENQMLPGILRGSGLATEEWRLLKEFEKYGSAYFKAYSTIDFMSYAQHYGLPTRLLDFTENPLIALMFSLYEEKNEENDDYYYIAIADMNQSLVFDSIPLRESLKYSEIKTELLLDKARESIEDLERMMKDERTRKDRVSLILICKVILEDKESLNRKLDEKVLFFVKPNQANQRISMQQGLFMLPYTLEKAELENSLEKQCKFIQIHKNLRKECLEYLDICGINTLRMMPDLTSICRDIRKKVVNTVS